MKWIDKMKDEPVLADLDSMGRVLVWNEFSQFAHLLHVDHLFREPAYTHWMKLPKKPE